MMRGGILLQARMASQRLPGKALAQIGGWPLVTHCIRRLAAKAGLPVILATTRRTDDDALAAAAAQAGAQLFRGSDHDVLDRFVRCAAQFELDVVIRATADNPGVDIDAPGRLIDALRSGHLEYVREDDLPCGAGVEGITVPALYRVGLLARDAFDREHVTTFVRRHPGLFRTQTLAVPATIARPDIRLTVDTADDLQSFRELHQATGRELPDVTELITAWDHHHRRSAA